MIAKTQQDYNDIIDNDPTLVCPDAGITSNGKAFPNSFDAPELQREIVAAIISDPQWLSFAASHIKPKDFVDKGHQALVSIALEHYSKFNTVPPVAVLRAEVKERFAENKALAYYLSCVETTVGAYIAGMDSIPYIRAKLIEFAKNRAAKNSYDKWIADAKQGKQDLNKTVAELHAGLALAASAFDEPKGGLMTIAELQDEPDLIWQVANHFPKNGTVTVFGSSGVGKSFYCLDLALSVASGIDFMGKFATQKGNVLYICAEGGYGLKGRVNAWLGQHGLKAFPGIVFSTAGHDLPDTAEIDALLGYAGAKLGKVELVIVDTLSRCFGAGDPDKNADMKGYLSGVDHIRQSTGATVVSIHHTGWTETERERGAKSLRDYCDTSICLATEDDCITITCKKQKDAKEFGAYVLQKVPKDNSLVLTMQGTKAEIRKAQKEATKSENEHQLLEFVPVTDGATGGVTIAQLMAKLGWTQQDANKVCKGLVESEAIYRWRDGGANQPWQYYRLA